MNELSTRDLENVIGGFSVWMGVGIAAIVVFLAGVLEGITNPNKCGNAGK